MADPTIRVATTVDAATVLSIELATIDEGRALVAVDASQRLVGSLTWSRSAGIFEIERVSVLPAAAGAGHGTGVNPPPQTRRLTRSPDQVVQVRNVSLIVTTGTAV